MNTFRGIERVIYEYLIGHASQLHEISAKTIANKALTTTTSVNRVCKKMGYASYTELRYKLALLRNSFSSRAALLRLIFSQYGKF
ncbi:hypothetical protein ACXZ7L_24150, partial [Vibrio campbellii]